jgi:ArsR family transcriptional regulator
MADCPTTIPRVGPGDLNLLDTARLIVLATAAKALSDPIRLQMVYLLTQYPDLCTCEFEAVLGLAQSKVSYHLKMLLDAGIVRREEHKTWSHYRLVNRSMLDRVQALVGNEQCATFV